MTLKKEKKQASDASQEFLPDCSETAVIIVSFAAPVVNRMRIAGAIFATLRKRLA